MRKYKKKKKRREKIPVLIHKQNSRNLFLRATIDYKNLILLRKFISSEGKILPRRFTRLSAKEQRKMATAIKSSRMVGFLPFINQ